MSCGVPNSIVNDSALMSALGREMTRAVQRMAVASGNLSNAETPGFRTQEMHFADALAGQMGALQPQATHDRHLGASADKGVVRDSAEAGPPRRDGNNVQMEHELLALGRAGSDFASAQTVLAAKFRLVRYAINEGR